MEAMKIVARFISENRNCKVIYNNNGEASADIINGVIRIPRIAEMNYEQLMRLRLFTYHEAGHIIETRMQKDDIPTNKTLFMIHNAVEDVRMELALYHRQPGTSEVFEWGVDYFNKKNGAAFAEGKHKDSPLWEALCAMEFVSRSRVLTWKLSPAAQWYYDIANPIFAKVSTCKNAMDTLEVAKEIYELLKTSVEEEMKDGSSSYANPNATPKPASLTEETSGEVLDRAMQDAKDFIDQQLKEEIEQIAAAAPPGDETYTACTDSDKIEIPPIKPGYGERYAEHRASMNGIIAAMSRNLEQALRTLTACQKRGHLETGKIDMRRLASIGKNLSKNIFYQLRPGEKLDTAVVMCIDESGSMSKYAEIQLLVIALSETLSKIGVPFEIYGATTVFGQGSTPPLNGFTRTNPIVYNLYKTFGENWEQVKERILNVSSRKHHVDGEVVQFCGLRLAGRREKRKIIFSLSDGAPCSGQEKEDDGKPNQRKMRDELGDNLIRVCKNLRGSGIEVYGFGIGTHSPEKFYGVENFLYLENSSEMGDTFFRKFSDIITKGRYRVGT
jgi:hypothetical protein